MKKHNSAHQTLLQLKRAWKQCPKQYAAMTAIVGILIISLFTNYAVNGTNTSMTGFAVSSAQSCMVDQDCGDNMCYQGVCFTPEISTEFRSKTGQDQYKYISYLQDLASKGGSGPTGSTDLQSPYFQDATNFQILETAKTGPGACPQFIYVCHADGMSTFKFKAHPQTCLKQENLGLVPCPNGCDQMTGQCKSQPAQNNPAYESPEENFDDFFVD